MKTSIKSRISFRFLLRLRKNKSKRGDERNRGREKEKERERKKLTSWREGGGRKRKRKLLSVPGGVRSSLFLFPFHPRKTNSRDFNDTRMIYAAATLKHVEEENEIFFSFLNPMWMWKAEETDRGDWRKITLVDWNEAEMSGEGGVEKLRIPACESWNQPRMYFSVNSRLFKCVARTAQSRGFVFYRKGRISVLPYISVHLGGTNLSNKVFN